MGDITEKYFYEIVNENGTLQSIELKNIEKFNFAYDIVEEIAKSKPEKRCMLWVDVEEKERSFTFAEMNRYAIKTANYFSSLGIGKGDKVMLVLKRHYQFWFSLLALHRLGAVAIPATHMLKCEDFEYRFEAGQVKALVCTDTSGVYIQAEQAITKKKLDIVKIMTGEAKEGWSAFDVEMEHFPDTMDKVETTEDDPMLMFFTSGTTGHPKIVTHDFKYPLGHYVTAKYWQHVNPDGIHFTLSDTGWGKALWGKIYGQWICEAAVFVYDIDDFVPHPFLQLFEKYPITTFCAPATAYRVFAKLDLKKYNLDKLEWVTTAGESLSPEIWKQFYDKTGLEIMEGFGQTETTLTLGNLYGTKTKPGSIGRPSPMYDIDIVNEDGKSVGDNVTGEMVIRTDKSIPCGLFCDYFGGTGNKADVWYDGMYHSGDNVYRDEDGYYWFVGRNDDLIKSTGYRVGPAEVESVIMELPYVLECAVIGIPDSQRGQLVMANIVVTDGTTVDRKLKLEIIKYCRTKMANYKCPKKIAFFDELPKTISGKIRRTELRKIAMED